MDVARLRRNMTCTSSWCWPGTLSWNKDFCISSVARSLVALIWRAVGWTSDTSTWRRWNTLNNTSSFELSRHSRDGIVSLWPIISFVQISRVSGAMCDRRLLSAELVLVVSTILPHRLPVPLSHSGAWSGCTYELVASLQRFLPRSLRERFPVLF